MDLGKHFGSHHGNGAIPDLPAVLRLVEEARQELASAGIFWSSPASRSASPSRRRAMTRVFG